MTLRVVGAGVGRTGTMSLKLALERLLGAPCYHMAEVIANPSHVELWNAAVDGSPDWDAMFADYQAAVDWPVASFWPELSEAYPDALVLLSVRDPHDWYRSASSTIFAIPWEDASSPMAPMLTMANRVLTSRFGVDYRDEAAAIAAFERHNAAVRATIPAERLVEWRPGEGWAPLCDALGTAVPDEPFPHANTRAEMRDMLGLS